VGIEIVAVLGLLLGNPRTKSHSDVGAMGRHREYGGRWWPPSSPGRDESCKSRVACGLS